jgi:hypothetical protein
MDAEIAKKLREPFLPNTIGKLPRVTCRDCSQRSCQKHQKAKCQVCGNYISTQHIHLDYVGHAAITDRLLQVDPAWSWEPVAFGQDGLPTVDKNGGLWIRLTVAGVTRLGYGDAEGKTGPSAVKEAIGDALRNGAMRFGVGLDLWHKDGQLVHDEEPAPQQRNGAQQRRTQPPAAQPSNGNASQASSAGATQGALRFVRQSAERKGIAWDDVRVEYAKRYEGEVIEDATDQNRLTAFAKLLTPAAEPATNGAQA